MQLNLDDYFLREDIISTLLAKQQESREEAAEYADRLRRIAHLENAEYASLVDPFDRSVALVFELVKDADLDPWNIDLAAFVEIFSKRIRTEADTIDLPACGRLLRLAWAVLRGQVEDLLDRQNRADLEEEGGDLFFDGGWLSEFEDDEFHFTNNVLSGEVESNLDDLFEERVRRDEGRPVTLGELLGALRDACDDAEILKSREENRKKYLLDIEEAMGNVTARVHDENLEADIENTWHLMRRLKQDDGIDLEMLVDGIEAELQQEALVEEDLRGEAKVTGLISMLFLTHLGFADISQDEAPHGRITIEDRWPDLEDWDAVQEKILSLNEADAETMRDETPFYIIERARLAEEAQQKAEEEAAELAAAEAEADEMQAADLDLPASDALRSEVEEVQAEDEPQESSTVVREVPA